MKIEDFETIISNKNRELQEVYRTIDKNVTYAKGLQVEIREITTKMNMLKLPTCSPEPANSKTGETIKTGENA